ncbi:hypothetical protein M413DRAFT_407739 [Hebeloma cylindrosporum]|uniref:Uncharacterized protein n=1 Tax=Hebeloma cylindrosporum TaxID=76867 RepID=A0A0C2YIH8_HEBCY|nr:hypothetical protein M413DRAFT_407739 [Hebeloma cylindrosporum h7]
MSPSSPLPQLSSIGVALDSRRVPMSRAMGRSWKNLRISKTQSLRYTESFSYATGPSINISSIDLDALSMSDSSSDASLDERLELGHQVLSRVAVFLKKVKVLGRKYLFRAQRGCEKRGCEGVDATSGVGEGSGLGSEWKLAGVTILELEEVEDPAGGDNVANPVTNEERERAKCDLAKKMELENVDRSNCEAAVVVKKNPGQPGIAQRWRRLVCRVETDLRPPSIPRQ